jgi:catechol 2,3-dioxygenase-like lactoylglutathione lyase family enzyme
MRIGEVCLLTGDAARLAAFYQRLLGLPDAGGDGDHRTLLSEETMLTVYADGEAKRNDNRNICLAFTVEDVDAVYRRLLAEGVPVAEPPADRPWGARNLCLLDPDGNRVYLRCFPKAGAGAPEA